MIQIKSIQGKVLYECSCNTHKEALEKAVKDNIDLSFANLSGLNLQGANLMGANLENTDFSYTNCKATIFQEANLKYAFFKDALAQYSNFTKANLTGACFEYSDLYYASFKYANLQDVNFKTANLRGANLIDAINVPYIPLACPSEGSFIGWKICRNYLIKLEIPEDARRSSATSNKCRCDKAKVLAITDFKEKTSFSRIINKHFKECIYEVGKMVYPDSFDEDRWNECSHGIHFLLTNKTQLIIGYE